ncbi:MAG: hypothetical protein Q9168_005665 [Polycauliona sp. 1 TL-2023]
MEDISKSDDQQDAESNIPHPEEHQEPSNTEEIIRHDDRPSREAAYFPFMKLSGELRNKVYEELLVVPNAISLTAWEGPFTPNRLHLSNNSLQAQRPSCAILQVSKLIHSEAFPILYGCNTFHCNSVEALNLLLSKKTEYRRSIRSLSFETSGFAPARSIKLLHGCTSLQTLKIHLSLDLVFDDYGLRSPHAIRRLPGLSDLLKLRGIREVEVVEPANLHPIYFAALRRRVDPDALTQQLQVLKRPKSAAMVRRQDDKDYPPEKAKRTVFGKANVKTRSERALEDKEMK